MSRHVNNIIAKNHTLPFVWIYEHLLLYKNIVGRLRLHRLNKFALSEFVFRKLMFGHTIGYVYKDKVTRASGDRQRNVRVINIHQHVSSNVPIVIGGMGNEYSKAEGNIAGVNKIFASNSENDHSRVGLVGSSRMILSDVLIAHPKVKASRINEMTSDEAVQYVGKNTTDHLRYDAHVYAPARKSELTSVKVNNLIYNLFKLCANSGVQYESALYKRGYIFVTNDVGKLNISKTNIVARKKISASNNPDHTDYLSVVYGRKNRYIKDVGLGAANNSNWLTSIRRDMYSFLREKYPAEGDSSALYREVSGTTTTMTPLRGYMSPDKTVLYSLDVLNISAYINAGRLQYVNKHESGGNGAVYAANDRVSLNDKNVEAASKLQAAIDLKINTKLLRAENNRISTLGISHRKALLIKTGDEAGRLYRAAKIPVSKSRFKQADGLVNTPRIRSFQRNMFTSVLQAGGFTKANSKSDHVHGHLPYTMAIQAVNSQREEVRSDDVAVHDRGVTKATIESNLKGNYSRDFNAWRMRAHGVADKKQNIYRTHHAFESLRSTNTTSNINEVISDFNKSRIFRSVVVKNSRFIGKNVSNTKNEVRNIVVPTSTVARVKGLVSPGISLHGYKYISDGETASISREKSRSFDNKSKKSSMHDVFNVIADNKLPNIKIGGPNVLLPMFLNKHAEFTSNSMYEDKTTAYTYNRLNNQRAQYAYLNTDLTGYNVSRFVHGKSSHEDVGGESRHLNRPGSLVFKLADSGNNVQASIARENIAHTELLHGIRVANSSSKAFMNDLNVVSIGSERKEMVGADNVSQEVGKHESALLMAEFTNPKLPNKRKSINEIATDVVIEVERRISLDRERRGIF